jgi:hypothetical protein
MGRENKQIGGSEFRTGPSPRQLKLLQKKEGQGLTKDEEGELRGLFRLREDRGQPELANEEMKNWRKHLRKQAKDRNAPVINTAGLTGEEVLQKLEEILKDIL